MSIRSDLRSYAMACPRCGKMMEPYTGCPCPKNIVKDRENTGIVLGTKLLVRVGAKDQFGFHRINGMIAEVVGYGNPEINPGTLRMKAPGVKTVFTLSIDDLSPI